MSDDLERGGFSSAAEELVKKFDEQDRKAGARGRAKAEDKKDDDAPKAPRGGGGDKDKLEFTDEEPKEGEGIPATKSGEGYKIKWKGGTIISQ